MQTHSIILDRLRKAEIRQSPSPYIVLEEAIPNKLYKKLASSWPNENSTFRGKDPPETYEYRRLSAHKFKNLNSRWQDFWNGWFSRDTQEALLDIWNNEIKKRYPWVLELPREFEIKRIDEHHTYSFMITGQYVWHKRSGRKAILPPHTDAGASLLFCLWYFKLDEDTSTGGDLALWETSKTPVRRGRYFADKDVKLIKTIPYSQNLLIMCLNTPQMVHSVEARPDGQLPRRHVGMTLELPGRSLFSHSNSDRVRVS